MENVYYRLGFVMKYNGARVYSTILHCNQLDPSMNHQSKWPTTIVIPRSYFAARTGQANAPDDYQNEAFSSSSYHHQSKYRSSYEQKRKKSQKSRSGNQSASRGEVSKSSLNQSHYQRLNIQPDADLETIKSAYYALSKIYHPDIAKTDDTTAAENFRLITESYNILNDEKLRMEYDRELNLNLNRDYTSEIFNSAANHNNDTRSFYRSPNADMLFRSHSETALEREKRLNPRKFRAGFFTNSGINDDHAWKIEHEKIKRRLDGLNSYMKTTQSSSEDDFYRTHLYYTMQRRHESLQDHHRMHSDRIIPDSSPLALLAAFGVMALLGISIFNLLVDYDIGKFLDQNFIENRQNSDQKKDPKRVS